jgi:ATP-binding cassette subfamily C protein
LTPPRAVPSGTPLPVAPGRTVGRHLWRLLRGRRLRLAGILVLFLLEAATSVVFPLVIGWFVDTVLDGGLNGPALPPALGIQIALLVAAALAAGVLAWAGAVTLARLAETVIAELREEFVDAALRLPRDRIEAAGTGDVVTRAGDDIAQISETLPEVLPRIAVSVFTLVLVGASLLALDLRYLAVFALTLPLYALTLRWYLRTAPPVYAAARRAESRRGGEVLATLTQLPTVTAHRLEARQLARTGDATWQTVRWSMRARIVQNRLFGRLNLIEALGLGAVLALGIALALTAGESPGAVTAATILYLRAMGPIAGLLMVMDDLQAALAALGRVIGVGEDVPAGTSAAADGAPDGRTEDAGSVGDAASADVPAGTHPAGDVPAGTTSSAAPPSSDPLVALEGVGFSYDGRTPVLSGIDLHLAAGERVAVVGETGSGKSTLAALVAGVHRPPTGRVRREVAEERIMTVAQESHLFEGSVRENLTLAAPGASDAQLRTALDRLGGAGLLEELPEGLDTRVGPGGHALGPAAVQHLALCRLELADPALIVLDEATAHGEGDRGLDLAASALVRDRSALIIAHRLSQAVECDRILVLDSGRIVESGTPAELVAAGGAFARLWEAWSAGR